MLLLLALPVAALVSASSPADIAAGFRHPLFAPALRLSALTTAVSLVVAVAAGTPLAWWIATRPRRRTRWAESIVDLPIVIPPAVIGLALLTAFGRNGLLGPALATADIRLPFTTVAVILAQVVVSAPFYIQAAAAAFRQVDEELIIVARTLGRTAAGAFFRVAVPLATPGLVAGAALSWARAMGEFGATLLFAGNLSGSTQTMPLAIYTAMESDARAAIALALVLAAAGGCVLLPLRFASR